MSSWNEKPVEVPTINVNLAPCDRHHLPLDKTDPAYHVVPGTGNLARCESPPILIPCPIPRSVTFTARLGECTCATRPGSMLLTRTVGLIEEAHEGSCPARPISVSCSISGETWEESEIRDMGIPIPVLADLVALRRVQDACRAQWALVKALVTGKRALSVMDIGWGVNDRLISQRDAVFAALAEEARLEQALCDAQSHSHALLSPIVVGESANRIGGNLVRRHSAAFLYAYVERLTDQVSVLEGA